MDTAVLSTIEQLYNVVDFLAGLRKEESCVI